MVLEEVTHWLKKVEDVIKVIKVTIDHGPPAIITFITTTTFITIFT